MRKFLIILLSILLLLVSCATKEVKQDEPEIEVIEATVVETPAPVVPEPEPEPVIPQEEPVPEPEPEPEPESEPQPVVEPVVEQEVIIVPVVVEEPAVEQPSEEDWSMVITASAPVEETPEEPETKEATETKPTEEKAPASAQTTAKAEEAAKPAANPSFVDKITDVFKKIGQFIMKEKLMSIGFLTCIIGAIYLIVALISKGTNHYNLCIFIKSHNLFKSSNTVHLRHCNIHSNQVNMWTKFLVLFNTFGTIYGCGNNIIAFTGKNLTKLFCNKHRIVNN